MYRNAMALVLLIALLGAGEVLAGQVKVFDNDSADGLFSTAMNWDGDTLPAAGDDLDIQAVCTIDSLMLDGLVYGNLTFSNASAKLLWSDATKTLKVLSVSSSAAGAELDMTGGGTLELSGSGAPFNLTNLTFVAGAGKVEYFAPSPIAQTITAAEYHNLIISGGRGSNDVILDAGVLSVFGTFDIFATFNPSFGVKADINNVFDYNGTGVQAIQPITYGKLKISGNRASASPGAPVYFLTGKAVLTSNGNALDVSSVTFAMGEGIAFDGGSIVEYAGVNDQDITPLPYDGLAFSGPGQKNILSGSTVDVFNTLTVNSPSVSIQSMGGLFVGALVGGPASSIDIDTNAILALTGFNFSDYDGAFSGQGLIVFQGTNGIFLSGDSSGFTGFVDIDSGFQVVLQSATALGSASTTVFTGSSLIADTATPIMLSITLDGGRLGAANLNDRKFAGSIAVTSNSNIMLANEANPSQSLSLEISGSISISAGNSLNVSGPPPVGGSLPNVLKIIGSVTGGTINIGPSAEVGIAPTGTFSSTTINVTTGGILTAINTTANQQVIVNLGMGAVLRGTGEFSDTCSVLSSGGIIQPGPLTGVGILPLTTGAGSPSALSLDATSVLEFDLGTPASSDRITVSGQLTLGGSLVLKPAAGFGPGTYTLLTHGGGLLGTGLNLPPPLPGLTYALDTTTVSTEVRLVVAALPIVITSPATVSGAVNEDFAYPITVTAPPAPPVTITTTALPIGLRLEGSSIVGIPTVAGSYTFTITATNGLTSATLLVTLTIADVDSTTVGSFSAEGKVGLPFFVDLADYSDNPTGVTFTTTALPEGLRLAGTTIIGTPKTAGETVVTVTGTKGATTGTGTVTITILAKTETLGTQLSDIISDPEEPGVNELVLFFVDAFHPEGLISTISWDFGDGTTSTGELVEKSFTSAGTYAVTVTATAGGKTTTLTKSVTVSNIDPNAPKIDSAVASPTPSVTGQLVTFTATGSDANNDALTYEWNLGTGAASVTGNPVTFTFTQTGQYLVTVKATDATGKTSRTKEFFHFVGDGSGERNENLDDEEVSFDGVKQKLTFSEDGLIGLQIDVDSLTRELLEVSTDFGITGRRSVAGETPSAKFVSAGLRVAKSTVREKETRKERGKARKTLAISSREVGAESKVETEPTDKSVSKLKLKGDFFPSRSSSGTEGALSRATKDEVAKSDKVSASGSITMPGGLDMSEGTEIEVALGNIIDKVVIDAKGKGKGRFTTLQMRIKTDKTTKKTIGDVAAKFSIKMSVADMIADGFDTEGVVVSKEQNGKEASIQAALLIGGVVYTADNPVTLKVSPKEDKAQMVTRSSSN